MTGADGGGRASADRIHIAAGGGILARRSSALLFVPESASGADELLAAFVDPDAVTVVDAVTDAATAAQFDIGPFVLVDWADDVHVVVLGPVEVRSDHASLPMLSGAGSGSWVERRLRVGATPVTIRTGDAASPSTDLQLGRVSASGFAATFSVGGASRPAPDPDPRPESRPAPGVPPVVTAVPPRTASSIASPTVASAAPPAAGDPTAPLGTDRLAALRAAMRGPTGPDGTSSSEPVADPTMRRSEPLVPHPSPVPIDDEVTLAPDDPPVERPASEPADDDHDQAPFVPARRCGRGHLNPPHVGACRTCGDLLDATAPTEQVRQPPLATLDLDDDLLPIDRPLVLGRKPDLGAAQATDRARLIVLAGDASVSRTHVRIDVEDWTLTVTDCGSRSGTAIVARPGEEPRILEPWVAHELPSGARLFLGGPTSVVIRPAGGR